MSGNGNEQFWYPDFKRVRSLHLTCVRTEWQSVCSYPSLDSLVVHTYYTFITSYNKDESFWQSLGPFLSKDFLSKLPGVFFAQFFVFPYFSLFFCPNIGMRSLPNILPSVKKRKIWKKVARLFV